MLLRLLPVVLLVAACAKKRDPAPTEMVDIAEFMFSQWEDDEAMAEALENLGPWLDGNVATEEAEKGFRLDPLLKADVADVTFPDRSFETLLGAAGGAISDFPVEDHAGHMILDDQLFSNPTNYKAYSREVVEGDENAFMSGSGVVRTVNQIETANFGVSIPYDLLKDYRWVESETRRAVIARSWIEERACGGSGSNCLELSFSVDLFVESGNKTQRLTATWSEVTSPLPLGDDALIAGLALGLQNVFYHTDQFLSGEQEL